MWDNFWKVSAAFPTTWVRVQKTYAAVPSFVSLLKIWASHVSLPSSHLHSLHTNRPIKLVVEFPLQ